MTAGQLLAEIESPEIDQQLQAGPSRSPAVREEPGSAEGQPRSRAVTMERYQAADAEGAVAKQAVDQNVSAHRTAQAARGRGTRRTVQSNQANVQRFQESDLVRACPRPLQRHGDSAERGCGRLDHGRQPHQSTPPWRRPASPARANGLFEVAQDRRTPRVRQRSPGLRAERESRSAGPGDGPRAAHAAGDWHGDPNRQCARSGHADPADAGRYSQPDRTGCCPECSSTSASRSGPPARTGGFRPPRSSSTRKARRVAIVGPGNKLHFQKVALGRDFGTSIDIQSRTATATKRS